MSRPGKTKKSPGPCPDPAHYTLVNGKEGKYWRLKRGTIKPAALNKAWEKSRANTQISSPAARRILLKLAPFTVGLAPYRRAAALSGMLRKSLNVKNQIDYSFFKGYDMQWEFPFSSLLQTEFSTTVENGMLYIRIFLYHKPVKAHSPLVTDYFFEAILLYGDATVENDLRVETDQSPLYSFTEVVDGVCTLTLQVPPDKLWMVWLKISCMEDDRRAVHPRHYGMKVVAVGGG